MDLKSILRDLYAKREGWTEQYLPWKRCKTPNQRTRPLPPTAARPRHFDGEGESRWGTLSGSKCQSG